MENAPNIHVFLSARKCLVLRVPLLFTEIDNKHKVTYVTLLRHGTKLLYSILFVQFITNILIAAACSLIIYVPYNSCRLFFFLLLFLVFLLLLLPFLLRFSFYTRLCSLFTYPSSSSSSPFYLYLYLCSAPYLRYFSTRIHRVHLQANTLSECMSALHKDYR